MQIHTFVTLAAFFQVAVTTVSMTQVGVTEPIPQTLCQHVKLQHLSQRGLFMA